MSGRLTVAIAGASGYAGGEFLRLALAHPQLLVTQVTSERFAGQGVQQVHPNLRSVTQLRFTGLEQLQDADVIVSALPHGELLQRADTLLAKTGLLIDLSADFRQLDPSVRQRHFAAPHERPDLAGTFVPAIPELTRARLQGASRIAGAGCIATAAILALTPLIRSGLSTRSDVIVEAKIGSSAAGNAPRSAGHHPERSGVIRTYSAVGHRHTAEIEQALGGGSRIHLTATAVERIRGILVTAHVFLPDGTSELDVRAAFRDSYEDEPFIRLIDGRRGIHRVPDPKVLDGSNWCDIGFALDHDSGRLVVMAALDNLVKGTAGHALQSLNIARGWDETLGLTFPGLHP
jgi:N-acetyl-gamma-glutamyl-phosphate/LysW-gamma-L-alpha-aminoadipyl-6-phosphate reductase